LKIKCIEKAWTWSVLTAAAAVDRRRRAQKSSIAS